MFTFTLGVFTDSSFDTPPTNPIALNKKLYLLAEVDTQSSTPNLDLHLVSCWASSDASAASVANKVVLITEG